MFRRRFLTVAGSVLATAGCTAGPSTSDGGDDAPTSSSSPTPTTSGGQSVDVAVSEPSVQPGFVDLATDSIGVWDDAGQYLLVHVDVVDGEAPAWSAFALRFDGLPVEPIEQPRGLWRDDDYGVEYRPEDATGWLVFGLPETGSATGSELQWPGGTWTPPARIRDRLAAPLPSFEGEFAAPATVDPGQGPTLSISATNTGDVAGNCVLALNRVGPNVAYTPVTDFVWDVEPGETRTTEWRGEPPKRDRDVTYHLRGAGIERRSRTIELAAGDGSASNGTDRGNSA